MESTCNAAEAQYGPVHDAYSTLGRGAADLSDTCASVLANTGHNVTLFVLIAIVLIGFGLVLRKPRDD